MTDTFKIGDQVAWKEVVNYGHTITRKAVVRKIGRTRITIEVDMEDGETRITDVRPYNLKPVAASKALE
jgi:acyl-CoA hydrolase